MFGLGMGEIAVIGAIGLLFFGGKRLPELGGALGKAIINFKKGLNEGLQEESSESESNKLDDQKKEKLPQ